MLNKNITSKLTAFFFSLLTLLILSSSVSAVTTKPTLNPTRVALRCQIATKKIQTIIDNYDKNRDLHLDRYNHAKESLTKLVTRLEANGYDVTKLKADLVTWNTKIVYFAEQVRILKEDMEASKQFSCKNNEDEYLAAIQKARAQLTVVHEAGKAVIVYYRGTIKPDLEAIRAQKPVTTTKVTPTI